MERIISSILKSSLFPILTEQLYNAGRERWVHDDKLISLILYLTGFLFTKLGLFILISIIIITILKNKGYI